MKKFFKGLGWLLLALFVGANVWMLATSNTYIYKALIYNYVNIDDINLFHNREIKAGTPQEWPLGKDYNKKSIPNELLAYHQKNKSVAYLIIKNDSIRYEQYWEGYGPQSLSNSFSMAKSYVSVLIGIALQEGKIKSLDEPISHYIDSYKTGARNKITIRQVLTMSTGLNWNESYSSLTSPTTKAYYGTDLHALLDEFDVDTTPGTVFNYQSGATQLLAFVLEKATGQHLADYLSEKLWKPMGCSISSQWSLDHEGGSEKAYCCIYSNARDFARLGKLYLQNGLWNGVQLVPADYVQACITPAALLDKDTNKPNDRYGYQWWIVPSYKGHRIFYMRGLLGQYVICVPDMQMIVVRLGEIRDTDGGPHPTDFYKYLDAAIQLYQ